MCGALTRNREERDIAATYSGVLDLCPSLIQPVIDTFGNDDVGRRRDGMGWLAGRVGCDQPRSHR